MMLFYCENCRIVYYPEPEPPMVLAPKCTNHTCSRYGQECEPMPIIISNGAGYPK